MPIALFALTSSGWIYNPADWKNNELLAPVSQSHRLASKSTLKQLQSCIADLGRPGIVLLYSNKDQSSYYVVFNILNRKEPIDMRPIKSLRTILVAGGRCRVLDKIQAKKLANQLFRSRYKNQIPVERGAIDIQAVWGDVVNRWERDAYVNGEPSAYYLDTEDIWIAKILNLHLPDYRPVYFNRPMLR